jgi:RNA polymerase sigma-70 factor, ECF subfamily
MSGLFHGQFVEVFRAQFPSVFRYLNRLTGDADLASDIAQDAFVRLYRRGEMPDHPDRWLLTVAVNLFRNDHAKMRRRRMLLTVNRAEGAMSDATATPEQASRAEHHRLRARQALERIPEREREMLLLRAEGFSYREIADALNLNAASVGTLLARAKTTFLEAYEGPPDAP